MSQVLHRPLRLSEWEAKRKRSFPNSALNDYSTIATGTRNLTPQEASYYRGKLYESRKKQGTRTDLTSAQNVPKLTTAEELGKEYGVSHMTIKRDAEFSKAVDKIAVLGFFSAWGTLLAELLLRSHPTQSLKQTQSPPFGIRQTYKTASEFDFSYVCCP